jgi:tRNA pseudouridine38-40 synthase
MTMRTLKLIVQYDGTDLVGWQRQKTGRSAQGLLEEALAAIGGAPVSVHGAGRTDAGVHAIAQVASARMTTALEPATLARALNAKLPPDVRVTSVVDAPDDFHARFSAKAKTYRYILLEAAAASPFAQRYVWRVPGRLNVEAMAEGARTLVGRHDFTAFQSTGSAVTHALRTVTAARVVEWDPTGPPPAPGVGSDQGPGTRLVVFDVTADGFLRHMVRAMTGTLIEVGQGRRPVNGIRAVVDGRLRATAGATAPAAGLWLVSVDYC